MLHESRNHIFLCDSFGESELKSELFVQAARMEDIKKANQSKKY